MRPAKLFAVIISILSVCAAVSACGRQFSRIAREHYFAERLRGIKTFNNCKSFAMDNNNSRRFVLRGASYAEPYLRFRVEDMNPSGLILRLRLKVPKKASRLCFVRSARGSGEKGVVVGDKVSFEIDMDPPDQYMWNDGFCYVGVAFAEGALSPGDTVELLDFKFLLK